MAWRLFSAHRRLLSPSRLRLGTRPAMLALKTFSVGPASVAITQAMRALTRLSRVGLRSGQKARTQYRRSGGDEAEEAKLAHLAET